MTDDFVINRRSALVLAAMVAAASRATAATTSWDAVDALANQIIAANHTPGISIAAMTGGKITRAKCYGIANLETGTPVMPETIFRIGSITKQFTAAAIMLLEQDGKLSVDDKFGKYFPDFPRGNEITLRQMLTHTSGLGNFTDRNSFAAYKQSAVIAYDSRSLLADMVEHTDPLFPHEPGTTWDYSNTAFVLLGLVVEKVGGEPWPAFFQRRLFGPAGLANTAVDDAATVVKNRATGYSGHAGDGALWDNSYYMSMSYPGAAGNMRSTAIDLCKWHDALLGGRVVGPAALKAMTTPVLLADGTLPLVARKPGGPKSPMKYGFGLIMDDLDGHASVGHGGGISGFISDIRSFPAEKTSISVLVNTDGSGRPKASDMHQQLLDAAARAALGI